MFPPVRNTCSVIWRKPWFVSWSQRGLRFVERVLSVRETLRSQDRSLYKFLMELWQGDEPPLLSA